MKTFAFRSVVLVLVLVLSALPAAAETVPSVETAPSVADVRLEPTGLQFQPQVPHGQLILTVNGPRSFYHRAVFNAGSAPSFRLTEGLADGTYTFELRVVPRLDEETRERLLAARGAGDASVVQELREAGRIPEFALVQSSSFTVRGGLVLTADRPEQIVTKDRVFGDDVIVEGGLCVGASCVNGEVFGFDSVRLKDTNLRIHFDDISTGTFPANDWRLVANDSESGGASYFAIEDSTASRQVFQVDAGAPSNAIRVDSDGDVGLGTATPAADLHAVSGDTPTLRLEQDGSSSLTPQTWELAGDEASFFLRDVTNSSKPLQFEEDAPENAIYVAADGDVGLNTDSPEAPLHVTRTSGAGLDVMLLENDGPTRLVFHNTASETSGSLWRLNADNVDDFRIVQGEDSEVELTLTHEGDLFIAGGLYTGTAGSCVYPTPCDGVFAPDYEVESIPEHAAYMWDNQHLRGVGPTKPESRINVTQKLTGVLHELEKAHIYIEQLHERVQELEERLDAE